MVKEAVANSLSLIPLGESDISVPSALVSPCGSLEVTSQRSPVIHQGPAPQPLLDLVTLVVCLGSSSLWVPEHCSLLTCLCLFFPTLIFCFFNHLTSVSIPQGPLTGQSARSTPSPRMISFSATFHGVIPPTHLHLQSGSLLHPDLSHLPLGHSHLPISSLN